MKKHAAVWLTATTCLFLAACAGEDKPGRYQVGKPYTIKGQVYTPSEREQFVETGIASWYGPGFQGKKTANGERFDMNELTGAHPTLQLPSLVRITNLENGRVLVVRINDRGPFSRARITDVTKKSAELLGFRNRGTAKVQLQLLGPESRALAEAARQGMDTSNAEIAVNETGYLEPRFAAFMPAVATPASMTTASISSAVQPIDISTSPNYPAPVQVPQAATPAVYTTAAAKAPHGQMVHNVPVRATYIYVQAGSFRSEESARNFALRQQQGVQSRIQPALIDGVTYYRVQMGPIETVEKADALLNTLLRSGTDASIIVSN